MMRIVRTGLMAWGLLAAGWVVAAEPAASPESVVQAYAARWNAGDLDGFIALHAPDVRKFRRVDATSQFEPITTGREQVREKYRPMFARTPRVRVEIVSMTSMGGIVVTRDLVSGTPDGHLSHELTAYEVRDGLIRAIWYLGRQSS